MDFELSDDQLALRDGARELLDGLAPTTRVRTVVDAGGGIDHGLWTAMDEQGWTAVEVPEDRGGLGLGAAVVVAETGDGPTLYALDLGERERPGREPAMDQTRELGWLHFDDTPAERLGGGAEVDALLDRGAALTAAEMLGGASRA